VLMIGDINQKLQEAQSGSKQKAASPMLARSRTTYVLRSFSDSNGKLIDRVAQTSTNDAGLTILCFPYTTGTRKPKNVLPIAHERCIAI
jgi:hypothetical protein